THSSSSHSTPAALFAPYSRSAHHRALHAFPTRRSSDLSAAIGIGGDGGDAGAENSGAVYVYTRNRTGWTEDAYIKSSETRAGDRDRKSTRLNSSHVKISYAVFCLKKKNNYKTSCTLSSL